MDSLAKAACSITPGYTVKPSGSIWVEASKKMVQLEASQEEVTDRAMNDKTQARLRRARKSRVRMRTAGDVRLSVNRTPRHIYAQIISGKGSNVLCAASTLDKDLRTKNGGNVDAASEVGKRIAERAKEKGIQSVAFDRSGFRYHGRVKALADAARESGLNF